MAVASGQMALHAGEAVRMILGFDPGRDKTGFAFVDMDGGLVLSGIFPTNERDAFFAGIETEERDLSAWITEGDASSLPENLIGHVAAVIIGDGTTSREFAGYVCERTSGWGCEAVTVDERNTTLEARSLYWKIHEPGMLVRLVPEGMRMPGRVLDDLAAWAVALRGLKKYRDISRNKL